MLADPERRRECGVERRAVLIEFIDDWPIVGAGVSGDDIRIALEAILVPLLCLLQGLSEADAREAFDVMYSRVHEDAVKEGTIDHIVKASIKLPESSLDDQLQDIEKRIIIEALKEATGIQNRAAEILGINQRSLWHRVKKHNIDTSLFKTYKN